LNPGKPNQNYPIDNNPYPVALKTSPEGTSNPSPQFIRGRDESVVQR
jgi:hypothetical protein